jgi:hypothetical protein
VSAVAAVPGILIAGPARRVVAVVLFLVAAFILLAVLVKIALLLVVGHVVSPWVEAASARHLGNR